MNEQSPRPVKPTELSSIQQAGGIALSPIVRPQASDIVHALIPVGVFPVSENIDAPYMPTETNEDDYKEVGFGKSDIDALQGKSSELRGIAYIEEGLERAIIGAGLQTLADKFGADKLLDAMRAQGSWTLQKVIEQLVPDKKKRTILYDELKNEPLDGLKERLNDTLGGTAYIFGNLELFRRAEIDSISGKPTYHGGNLLRTSNNDGITDSGNLLLGGDLFSLFKNHPELLDQFRESNDTLLLLKGVRDIYSTKYTQFATDLERAKTEVDKKLAASEAGFTELNALADSVYRTEMAQLEDRLESETNVESKTLIQSILDKRRAEVDAATEELDSEMKAARYKILSDLGADRLTGLRVFEPSKPELIDLGDV